MYDYENVKAYVFDETAISAVCAAQTCCDGGKQSFQECPAQFRRHYCEIQLFRNSGGVFLATGKLRTIVADTILFVSVVGALTFCHANMVADRLEDKPDKYNITVDGEATQPIHLKVDAQQALKLADYACEQKRAGRFHNFFYKDGGTVFRNLRKKRFTKDSKRCERAWMGHETCEFCTALVEYPTAKTKGPRDPKVMRQP